MTMVPKSPRVGRSPKLKAKWLSNTLAYQYGGNNGKQKSEIIVLCNDIDQYLQDIFQSIDTKARGKITSEEFKLLTDVLYLRDLNEHVDTAGDLSFSEFHGRLCERFASYGDYTGFLVNQNFRTINVDDSGTKNGNGTKTENSASVRRRKEFQRRLANSKTHNCIHDAQIFKNWDKLRLSGLRLSEMREQIDLMQYEVTFHKEEAQSLKEIIEDLRSMLQASDAQNIGLQVALKKCQHKLLGDTDYVYSRSLRRCSLPVDGTKLQYHPLQGEDKSVRILSRELNQLRELRDKEVNELITFNNQLQRDVTDLSREICTLEDENRKLKGQLDLITKTYNSCRELFAVCVESFKEVERANSDVFNGDSVPPSPSPVRTPSLTRKFSFSNSRPRDRPVEIKQPVIESGYTTVYNRKRSMLQASDAQNIGLQVALKKCQHKLLGDTDYVYSRSLRRCSLPVDGTKLQYHPLQGEDKSVRILSRELNQLRELRDKEVNELITFNNQLQRDVTDLSREICTLEDENRKLKGQLDLITKTYNSCRELFAVCVESFKEVERANSDVFNGDSVPPSPSPVRTPSLTRKFSFSNSRPRDRPVEIKQPVIESDVHLPPEVVLIKRLEHEIDTLQEVNNAQLQDMARQGNDLTSCRRHLQTANFQVEALETECGRLLALEDQLVSVFNLLQKGRSQCLSRKTLGQLLLDVIDSSFGEDEQDITETVMILSVLTLFLLEVVLSNKDSCNRDSLSSGEHHGSSSVYAYSFSSRHDSRPVHQNASTDIVGMSALSVSNLVKQYANIRDTREVEQIRMRRIEWRLKHWIKN